MDGQSTMVNQGEPPAPHTMTMQRRKTSRNGLDLSGVRLGQSGQMLPRIQTSGMPIRPGDLHCIVSDRCHRRRLDEVWNRIGIEHPFAGDLINTAGTGTMGPHEFERDTMQRPVVPLQLENPALAD